MPTVISPVVVEAEEADFLLGVEALEVKEFLVAVAYLVGVVGKDLLLSTSQPDFLYRCVYSVLHL